VVFGIAPKISFPKLFHVGNANIVGDESSGATPELARGTRALPLPASEFGLSGHRRVAGDRRGRRFELIPYFAGWTAFVPPGGAGCGYGK
jgi:hypothetical protein